MDTEARIKKFAADPEEIIHALAMLKVGHDKGDDPHYIMQVLLADMLLRFHRIPARKGQN